MMGKSGKVSSTKEQKVTNMHTGLLDEKLKINSPGKRSKKIKTKTNTLKKKRREFDNTNDEDKNKLLSATQCIDFESNQQPDSEIKSHSDTNENKPVNAVARNRKERTRMKLEAQRLKKGLVMLSPKSEAKIYKLKKALYKKGLPEAEIKQIIRQKRRSEELKLRKDQGCDIRSKSDQSVCFRCRKPGHRIADCKLVVGDSDQGVGVCFRCGSTEHILRNCSSKLSKGSLPFAKCFVCGQQGHLSKECPSNPKGAFPQGGKCNFCASVNHLKKDCPQLNEDNEDEFTAVTVRAGSSADALD